MTLHVTAWNPDGSTKYVHVYLCVSEIVREFGVRRNEVMKAIWREQLTPLPRPEYKLSQLWIARSDVERWLRENPAVDRNEAA